MATLKSLQFDIKSSWDGAGVRQATADLDALKAKIDDLSSKSINVKASVDATQADASIQELKTNMDSLSNQSVKANVDTTEADAKVADLKQKLDDLAKARDAQVNAKLLGDDTVKARMDELVKTREADVKAALDDADADVKMALLTRTRDVKIIADVDKSSLDKFNEDLDKMKEKLAWVNSGISNLIAGIIPLAAATVTLSGGVLALTGAFTSGFGAATVALVPFAASMYGTYKSVTTLYSTVAPLNQQLAQQEAQLRTLTPGSAAYAAQQQTIASTQQQINQAMAAATPVERALEGDLEKLRATWQAFQTQAEKFTGPIIAAGFQTLTGVIQHMLPLVAAVAPMFQRVMNAANAFAHSNGMTNFVTWIINVGVPDLQNIGRAVLNLFKVIGDAVKAFAADGVGFTQWLADITGRLANFAGPENGFQRFADMVRQEWPTIKAALENIGTLIGHVIQALAGFGPAALLGIAKLAELLDKLSPGQLQAVVIGFYALKAAVAGLAVVSGIINGIKDAQAAWTAIQGAWDAVMGAGAIVATAFDISLGALALTVGIVVVALAGIGIGIYEMVTHWSAVAHAFETAWNDVWQGVKTAAIAVWDFLKANWQYLIIAFGPIGWLVDIATHWSTVWHGIETIANDVWNALKVAWSAFTAAFMTAFNTIAGGLESAWNTVWSAIKTAATTIWDGLKAAWQAFITGVQSAWSAFSGAMTSAWQTFWNAIKTAAQAVWDGLKAAWQAFITGVQAVWSAFQSFLTGAWNTFWNLLKTVAQAIWNALRAAWQAFITGLQTIWSAFQSFLTGAWNTFWNLLKTTATTIWDALKQLWTTFLQGVQTAWQAVSTALGAAWQTFWNTIKTVATTVWNDLMTAAKNVWNTIKSDFSGLVSDVTKIWSGITNAFENPIHTIENFWNAIASKLGLPTLADGGTVGGVSTGSYAGGGGLIKGPGGSRQDKIPMAFVSNDEYVVNGGSVRKYGTQMLDAINSGHFANGGIVMLAGGGSPANPGGTGSVNPNTGGSAQTSPGSSNTPSNIGSPAFKQAIGADPGTSLAGLVGNALFSAFSAAVNGVVNAIPHPIAQFGTALGDLPWGGAKMVASHMLSLVKPKTDAQQAQINAAAAAAAAGAGHYSAGGGSASNAQLDQWLQAAGIPQSEWGAYTQLALQESTFNPNAYNPAPTSSGNAAGLFQITSGTFAAYGSGSVYNPVDNARAAQAYINAVYGGNVNEAVYKSANGGYAAGTSFASGGVHWVGENGPELMGFGGGETVDPMDKIVDGISQAVKGGGGGGIGGDVNLHITVNGAGSTGQQMGQDIAGAAIPMLEQFMRAGSGRR